MNVLIFHKNDRTPGCDVIAKVDVAIECGEKTFRIFKHRYCTMDPTSLQNLPIELLPDVIKKPMGKLKWD